MTVGLAVHEDPGERPVSVTSRVYSGIAENVRLNVVFASLTVTLGDTETVIQKHPALPLYRSAFQTGLITTLSAQFWAIILHLQET